jgi:hypothetical protein
MVEQDIYPKKALFSVGTSSWILKENDSFPYVCCLKRTDTYRMNGHRIFVDTTTTVRITRGKFLLAINYGLFVESNSKKLRRARLKTNNERWETRPARTYFRGIQIKTSNHTF